MDLSMTLEATMIENNPEMRKMYLAIAAKQESPLIFKYKYDQIFFKKKKIINNENISLSYSFFCFRIIRFI